MKSCNFIDDFKRDAVAQFTERGYPVNGGFAAPHFCWPWCFHTSTRSYQKLQ
jgi:hypothetical protein